MSLVGHCNCKAITITIAEPLAGQDPYPHIYCHCTTCKRQSGASGTMFLIADDSLVKVDDPQGVQKTWKDTLTDSGTPLDRQFCGNCGCPLTSISPLYAGKTIVKLGLFDKIPKPVAEIYCKNKQAWEPEFGSVLGITVVQGAL